MIEPGMNTDTVIIYSQSGEILFTIEDVIKIVISEGYTRIHIRDERAPNSVRKFSTNLPFAYYE